MDVNVVNKSNLRVMVGRQIRIWCDEHLPFQILANFCGCTDYAKLASKHDSGDPEIHRKLEMLAGPYGEVVFKAWKALHG